MTDLDVDGIAHTWSTLATTEEMAYYAGEVMDSLIGEVRRLREIVERYERSFEANESQVPETVPAETELFE